MHPGDVVENPQHRKMIEVSCPAAWKPPVIACAGTVMTFPGPAVRLQLTRRFGATPARGQISLLPARLQGESHSQMEGSRAEGGLEHAKRGNFPESGKFHAIRVPDRVLVFKYFARYRSLRVQLGTSIRLYRDAQVILADGWITEGLSGYP